MSGKYILSIDQGTTGTTALVLDRNLSILAKANHEFPQHFPHPGWVEHNADEIWTSVEHSVRDCLKVSGINPRDIACIGITNQRETCTFFDVHGKALHNFIVWQCRRSANICADLKAQGYELAIREKTGLVLDPYFSATKVQWLFQHHPHIAKQAHQGLAKFGTIDSWLIYKLSGTTAHVTDPTNASRSMFMNITYGDWDRSLLDIFQLPAQCLPHIVKNDEIVGVTKGLSFLPDNIPLCASIGDQQSALLGQGCLDAGEAKATFGTGSFILLNTGTKRVHSSAGLVSSIALETHERRTYCLEGSAFIAGAAVQWLRDGLGIIKSASEIQELAQRVEDSGEVVFVPALTGLGAPYWKSDARGLVTGITRDTTKAHLARAVLEGIALQNLDIIEAMKQDGVSLSSLKVDGGAARDNLLMQLQADVIQLNCERPQNYEATAIGAAMMAGVAVGMFDNLADCKALLQVDRKFVPAMDEAKRSKLLSKWKKAIAKI